LGFQPSLFTVVINFLLATLFLLAAAVLRALFCCSLAALSFGFLGASLLGGGLGLGRLRHLELLFRRLRIQV